MRTVNAWYVLGGLLCACAPQEEPRAPSPPPVAAASEPSPTASPRASASAAEPLAVPSSSAPSGSAAPPAQPNPPKPDRIAELLARDQQASDDERAELLRALGIEELEMGTVTRADVDDTPGDEVLVESVPLGIMFGTSRTHVVVRVTEGRSTVLGRTRLHQSPGGAGVTSFSEDDVSIIAAPQAGKSQLVYKLDARDVHSETTKVLRQSVEWEVTSFRGTERVVHLRASAAVVDQVEWALARDGDKLVRRAAYDPHARPAETWTWDDAAKRWQGTGPNGKWWTKVDKKARPAAPRRR